MSTWFSKMCRLFYRSQSSSKLWRHSLRKNSSYFADWKTTRRLQTCCQRPCRASQLPKTSNRFCLFWAICSGIKLLRIRYLQSHLLRLESWRLSKLIACSKWQVNFKKCPILDKVWRKYLAVCLRPLYSSNSTSCKGSGRKTTLYCNCLTSLLMLWSSTDELWESTTLQTARSKLSADFHPHKDLI